MIAHLVELEKQKSSDSQKNKNKNTNNQKFDNDIENFDEIEEKFENLFGK
jgi:hypothetical protein